ncbi:MAG: methyltransferase domain-containing protein [Myxococcales bacterium]|nr:methyltransferase domain-containing protein [Myxococcales bacterium]
MKPRLTDYLACPDCAGDLRLDPSQERDGEEILRGTLACVGCARRYPIEGGVPRLLPTGVDALAVEVAEGFGWEWNRFDELRPQYRKQFLDWISPISPGDFAGKIVVEGGCGKGRHTAIVASFGAQEVLSVDLGSAVEVAYRNTRHLPQVHIIQGDITHLPLKRCADLAFSIGVLHHMPDPRVGFRALAGKVRPGGRVAVWVYGHEGNEWIVDFVNPVRKRVTSRMPRGLLFHLSWPLALLVAGSAKGVYRPLSRGPGRALQQRLPSADFLSYIADFPVREIHTIVFDQLVTPVAFYLRQEEVAAWFAEPRFTEVAIMWHNRNSWRGHATVNG